MLLALAEPKKVIPMSFFRLYSFFVWKKMNMRNSNRKKPHTGMRLCLDERLDILIIVKASECGFHQGTKVKSLSLDPEYMSAHYF